MNKKERRKIYWQMYCAAIGLAQIDPAEVWESYLSGDFLCDELPPGFCRMYGIIIGDRFGFSDANIMLPELDLHKNKDDFKYPKGNWRLRIKPLEKAIALTYKK